MIVALFGDTIQCFLLFFMRLSPIKRGRSRENQFMPYVNNKGADEPAHLHSLISAFVVCCLDSIPTLAKSKISSVKLKSAAEQASLSLTWLPTPKTSFLVMWLKLDQINKWAA